MKKFVLMPSVFSVMFLFAASLPAADTWTQTQDAESNLTEEEKEKQERLKKFKAKAAALGEGKAGAYTPPAEESDEAPKMDGLYRPQERMGR